VERGCRAGADAARPRDFAAAQFKSRTTETGSLPTDDDLIRTITDGVPGTSMPGWQKFLSTADAPSAQTVAAGKAVYEKLRCAACHGTDEKGVSELG
jgi:hypothetical protein